MKMDIPGEGLLGKLWNTIADKGIGSLLKPWQIRREGRALTDVKRLDLLALAQAERDAEAIRRGEKTLLEEHRMYRLADEPIPAALRSLPSPDKESEPIDVLSVTQRNVVADSIHREVHVAKAVLHAESELESDSSAGTGKEPSEDWLYRWRDYASGVSDEALQALWGRVLAGEVKSPGQFSLRLLNFLSNLSSNEAQLIEAALPFVIDGFIFKGAQKELDAAGLNFSRLLELQELGFLSGVDAIGLEKSYSMEGKDKFQLMLRANKFAIGVRSHDPKVKLSVPAFPVTKMGRELLVFGSYNDNLGYLRLVGQAIKNKGFVVQMGELVMVNERQSMLVNFEDL